MQFRDTRTSTATRTFVGRRVGVRAADDDLGLELSELEVEALDSSIGDESEGLRVSGSIGASGLTFDFALDAAFARVDRRMAMIITLTLGDAEPVDRDGHLEILLG